MYGLTVTGRNVLVQGKNTITVTISPRHGQHRRCSLPLVGVTIQMPRAGVFQNAPAEPSSTVHAGLDGL